MKKVVVIIGPTAIGKTALSIAIAKHYNTEIISGDSIQVYRELNIASAKVTIDERKQVKHHLIDILNIDDNYSVAQFQSNCRMLIDEITNKQKLPLLVGGTGFYIKAALYDYVFHDENKEEKDYSTYSNDDLMAYLKQFDYQTALTIHINNRNRLIRAIEMAINGVKKSDVLSQQQHEPIYDIYIIGLTMPRDRLYQRINTRVDVMVENGLLTEITQLVGKYPDLFSYQSMMGIGYREWQSYFAKESTLEEVCEEIKKHSRQFAKRQYTWFNNQMSVKWYDVEEKGMQEKVFNDLDEWLNNNE